ncbi:hypothetical protein K443DRAFT_6288 [Laccaria amethystina LaAM-08-1]|uniref:Uncharacterized protein n=1 Tax=Laccaria amethystina LaAM-08-1 TaxID=1095629 RepID=A0A0C9Y2C5_9AGAR|nr:hypothetical protein K443DRAFT_6288 [Laccaria amethystina LaAM-08-1]
MAFSSMLNVDWKIMKKPAMNLKTQTLRSNFANELLLAPCIDIMGSTSLDTAKKGTAGVAGILKFAFGEWGWTWRDRVANGGVYPRRNRAHTATQTRIPTEAHTYLDSLNYDKFYLSLNFRRSTLLFLPLVTPN